MTPWERSRRMIYERDQGTCGFCGDHVDWGKDLHLDHRLPASQGGRATLDNLRVAHRSCNLSAGRVLRDAPFRPDPHASRVRIIIAIAPELREQLRALAKRERRSLTTQVEILIEHGLRAVQVAA